MFAALSAATLDEEARQDVHAFASRCFKDDKGEQFETREIDRIFHTHIDECQRDEKFAGILAPTSSGKSIQIAIIRDRLDSFLQRNNLIITGHHDYGSEFEPFGQVHGTDRNVSASCFNILIEDLERKSGTLNRFPGSV